MMLKDALNPIIAGVVSLFIIILSTMVLVVQSGTVNPSGNSFASVQLVIGIAGVLISLGLAIAWWRKPEEFRLEYQEHEDPTPPSCVFNFFSFLVAISIISLSALLLVSEGKVAEEKGADPSDIFIFAAITLSISVLALIYFGSHVFVWGYHKYRA